MRADLRELVGSRQWYHTIELAPGVETPGFFDLRSVAKAVLPESLQGMRCLDVAAFDGFWTLELKARGAREVVAIDLLDPRDWDWPVGASPEVIAGIGERKRAGEGFKLVMDALGQEAQRHDLSVYDLDPAALGTFDFIYVGSLLLHLRDPVRALERVRGVCSGRMLLVDNYDPLLTWLHPRRPIATLDGDGRPWWWRANAAGLARMVCSAGWEIVERPKRVALPAGRGQTAPRIRPRTLRSRSNRFAIRSVRWGDPHLAILARPKPNL
jgi:tRNA (mo5U34)-methyltransferase